MPLLPKSLSCWPPSDGRIAFAASQDAELGPSPAAGPPASLPRLSPAAPSSLQVGTVLGPSLARQHSAPRLHRVGAPDSLVEGAGFELLHATEIPQSVWGSSGSNFPCQTTAGGYQRKS